MEGFTKKSHKKRSQENTNNYNLIESVTKTHSIFKLFFVYIVCLNVYIFLQVGTDMQFFVLEWKFPQLLYFNYIYFNYGILQSTCIAYEYFT